MELRRLKRHVINRGGLCEAWLVYAEARDPDPPGAATRPRLSRAFWTRAEAGEWAEANQRSDPLNRYDVYRIVLDEQCVSENTLRPAYHVPAVAGDVAASDRPPISVTPGAIAHAFR